MTLRVLVGRVFFSESARTAIEELAGDEPADVAWAVTPWSQRSLALAAVEQEIGAAIPHTTIGAIVHAADLRLHRWRPCKTSLWDEAAVARTLRSLWYDERIETRSVGRRGEVVRALDEQPNRQVLERAAPKQPGRPGQIERPEFEDRRQGPLNFLTSLTLHTGQMRSECLDKNAGQHFRPALCRLLPPYAWARRLHLVMANGSSHTSAATTAFLAARAPRGQVLFTPPDASWRNQAESLLAAFSEGYLLRGSWCRRAKMIDQLAASTQDYNRPCAHPFAWRWACQAFKFWLNNTPGLIRCRT